MNALDTVLAKLTRTLRGMVGRCVLTAIDDGKNMQLVDVTTATRTKRSQLEHFQPYGFSSHPLPGAEGVVGFMGGAQEHGIVFLVADRRYRLHPLQAGGVALHDQIGNVIEIRPDDGEIRVTAQTKVAITAPSTVITGPLTVSGFVQLLGNMNVDGGIVAAEVMSEAADLNMTQIKNLYNSHTHPGGGGPNPQM